MDKIPEYSPAQLESKEILWGKEIARLDAIEYSMDDKIKEIVAALNLNGINTVASCEGHALEERGEGDMPWPWIWIQAPDEPAEKFIGQNEALQEAATQKNITLSELMASEEYFDVIEKVSSNPLTSEYAEWERKNKELQNKVFLLLEEFYKERKTAEEIKLKIDDGLHSELGDFYLTTVSDKNLNERVSSGQLSIDEKKELADKLPEWQQEMKDFSAFLKAKFFTNH